MNRAAIIPAQDGHCDLCGEPIPQEDVSVEAFEASGLLICPLCNEHNLEALNYERTCHAL